jgi:hypothetical protein
MPGRSQPVFRRHTPNEISPGRTNAALQTMDTMLRLNVASSDAEAFILCLAFGTLNAMRSGVWPLGAGVWTLARPAFVETLPRASISDELLDILRRADELSALAELGGRAAADDEMDRMLNTVRARLSSLPEKSWSATWENRE